MRYLEALTTQPHAMERQPTGDRAGLSERRFGAAGLRAVWVPPGARPLHLIHYRWESTQAALLRLAELEPSPFDDVMMEYIDPVTGCSVLPTLGCYIQMIRPGVRTRSHYQSSSAVYCALRGSGESLIDGVRYGWQQGDFFVVPPGARHAHANGGADPAILFSVQDVPLLTALGFYHEEE